MQIKGESVHFYDFFKLFIKNTLIFLLYLAIILIIPIFSIFYENDFLPYSSLFYQIGGIFLLYIDEKYKMNRESSKYVKCNTFFLAILHSPKNIKFSLNNMYKYLINPPTQECDITNNVSISKINHEYSTIESENEKENARIKSFESDLGMLRYFSEVRKAGYVLLSGGFVLQFLAIILT